MSGLSRNSSRFTRSLFAAVCLIGAGVAFAPGDLSQAADQPKPQAHNTMRDRLYSFQSDAELKRYLQRLIPKEAPPPASPPPPPAMAGTELDTVTTAAANEPAASDKITNTQESGVDEGDIVKKRGDTLVILRRGRLFTVSLANHAMNPVDSVNAYPPGVDARDDWYDEMLISGNRVIVIGYSYSRGGTEINRFQLSGDGRLKFDDAYQLRSNDYYSSRNYASRLVGHTLVFYSPYYLRMWGTQPFDLMPALRRWTGDAKVGFTRIVSARHIYIPPSLLNDDRVESLHTITTCDLNAAVLDCNATGVFGPASRTFYVSQHAVYVWATAWWIDTSRDKRKSPSFLYRLPLDGSEPSAIGVRGSPVDQFSFREDIGREDNVLNVLVRAEAAGDAMWNGEFSAGAVALLRLPLDLFGDGTREVPIADYRRLPSPSNDSYSFQNRFVGNYVLYGTGNDWGAPVNRHSMLVAAAVNGDAVTRLDLPHGVDRIEIMGRDAVVIGSDEKNLYFSAVELTSEKPMLGDRYTLKSAVQGETRSHGFFFKPDGDTRDDSGVLGLPIARPGREAYQQLFQNSAGMLFLRRSDKHFSPLGELDARTQGIADDNCVASCVDWYGNARPIFAGPRTFALLGYELIEGDVQDKAIREIGRVSFAPAGGKPLD
ncbi:MAG: beta-propeller domain-containing protein [Proteobacteria bacterium]|nr:beta-propeller domain-containing protein [Pseudomonadota bacterium]